MKSVKNSAESLKLGYFYYEQQVAAAKAGGSAAPDTFC
jgi:hypothetical protein